MAKTGAFSYDFSVADSSKFTLNFGPVLAEIVDGQGVLTPAGQWSDIFSTNTYDFTGSYISVEAVQMEANGTSYFDVTSGGGNYVAIAYYFSDNTIRFIESHTGIEDSEQLPYDPVEHHWWRIREISGTLYWDTSPNGIRWTNRRVKVTPNAYTVVNVEVYTDGAAGSSIFDNFNMVPLINDIPGAPPQRGITDRVRWSVIEANSNNLLTHDLNVMEPELMINLSGPSRMAFKLLPTEAQRSAVGIDWKTLGQVIVANIEIDYVEQIFGVGYVTDHKVDPKSGVLQIETTGFIGYPKGEPCLINFNPIAVDPFEVVQTVWAFLQGFSNAQMGVEVYPSSSGTQMLPGYSFDGSILSFDFFAIFLRAVDFPDSAGIIAGLARDIPFDMIEQAEWNADKTELTPKIQLCYPYGGLQQDNLAFRMGENVISGERAEEMDVEPVSDIVIRSWLPGRVISSQLSNADPTRYRRTAMEEDVYIESTERAAAWARRKLTKRNIPKSFSKITVLPNHAHAPFGSYGLGDTIYIEAPDYPWTGDIAEWHRITSISYAPDQGLVELGVMVEGAFNYDPIDYDPTPEDNPIEDLNRLSNGYFSDNLSGWISLQGQWIRVATVTFDTVLNPDAGCVRIDLDDAGERFMSNRAFCVPGEHLKIQGAVRWQEVTSGALDAFQLVAFFSHDATPVGDPVVIDEYVNPSGTHGWELFQDSDFVVPDDVNEISLQFTVTPGVTAGIAFWTYARVVPSGSLP